MLGYRCPIDLSKYPVLLIFLTCICSWFTGLGVGVILGSREPRSNPSGPVIYSVVCLFVLTFFFSFMLIRFVRQQPNSASTKTTS
jgi:hypothetical protein